MFEIIKGKYKIGLIVSVLAFVFLAVGQVTESKIIYSVKCKNPTLEYYDTELAHLMIQEGQRVYVFGPKSGGIVSFTGPKTDLTRISIRINDMSEMDGILYADMMTSLVGTVFKDKKYSQAPSKEALVFIYTHNSGCNIFGKIKIGISSEDGDKTVNFILK